MPNLVKLCCGILGLLALMLTMAATAQTTPPSFSKAFSPATIGPGNVSTLTFTINNTGSAQPAESLAFTDALPAGVTIATPAIASTTCLTPSLTAPDGGSTISLTGASVPGSASCTVNVDITSTTPGTHMNVSGDLTSTAGNSGTASADLDVVTTLPGFSKSFAPATVNSGGRSTMTFVIDNTANAAVVSHLDFTDTLPAGMVVASPASASTDCVSSLNDTTIIATPGTSIVVLDANGFGITGFEVLAAGASCTVSVDVIASGSNGLINVTELQADFTTSGKASAVLDVVIDELALSKSFTDDPVAPGTDVTLRFVIENRNRSNAATSIAFSDDFAASLAGLAAASVDSNTCGGTVDISTPSIMTFSGGSLAADGGSCEIIVRLAVPMSATEGAYPNTTSNITASTGTFSPASETLFVSAGPVISKSFTNDPVGPGGTVTLEFTIENPSPIFAASAITFTDELTTFLPFPLNVTLPPVPDPACGAGSTVSVNYIDTDREGLVLTGGSLAAGSSCTFSVDVTIPAGFPGGTYTNTTEPVTGTLDGTVRTGNQAIDDLVVLGAPTLKKSFIDFPPADPVLPGGNVILEFTISHDALAPGNASNIAFSDDLDAALTGLATSGMATNTCGGTFDNGGGSNLSLTGGGPLAPGASCTISVELLVPSGALPGAHLNTTSAITADVGDGMAGTVAVTGKPAQDDLNILGLTLSKSFTDDPVVPGNTVTLEFTLDNSASLQDATGIVFTDSLAGVLPGTPDLTVTSPLPLVDPCGAGSSLIGPSLLIFTGGALTAGATCTFSVTVLVPAGTADGTYTNTTSDVTATVGANPVTLSRAADNLVVGSSGLLLGTKTFTNDPAEQGGTVTLEFTLSNGYGTAATALAFTDDLEATLTGLTATSVGSNSCGGTVDISTPSQVAFSGGGLATDASCSFSTTLQVPAAAITGDYINTTSSISANVDGTAATGGAMSDTLTVTEPSPFDDVPNSHVDFPSILAVYDAGIATGCGGGNFCPDQIVTRDLAAIWLWKAKNNPIAPPVVGPRTKVYNDVRFRDFAVNWILGIKNEGITEGCDTINYCPQQVLTKDQAAMMLLKAANISPISGAGSVYDDVPDGHFAEDWIRAMKTYRYSEGCDVNNFCPDEALTLTGFSKLLAKVFNLVP